MASTISVQNVVDSLRSYDDLFPIQGASGWESEPAVSIANEVLQFILAPPFAWRWNRAVATFSTVVGTQDYIPSPTLPSFGWLEKATVAFGGTPTRELNVVLNLAEATQQALPTHLAARLDDGGGNITFRFLPVPDQIYTTTLAYQKTAPTITALNNSWAPLPDYMYYLYFSGFRAMALRHQNDPRYFGEIDMFMRLLVMANAGLSESQVNIFLGDKIDSARQQQAALGVAPSRAHASRMQASPQ